MNDSLNNRIRQCPNLPTLPAIAMQVLTLAQNADVDIAEIARIISRDPALSSKILRTVNSSFYARSQNVSTISHALVILGLQSVKTLVLGFTLVSNLTKAKTNGFRHMDYWRRSIFAATASRMTALRLGLVQQEEAFLAALLADIGMLVLDQVLGSEYGEIYAKAASHDELAALERQALGGDHAEVAGILATQWKLPPLLATPMAFHHSPEQVNDPNLRKLTELVQFAGHCAEVFVDSSPAAAIASVRALSKNLYKMEEKDCDALLEEIGTSTKEVACLFEFNIGPTADYDAILKKANETLVEITLQSQQQATTLKQQATTLSAQNEVLKRQAITDALTGLPNRARFDQFFAEQFAEAQKGNKPLALLMLDVDQFKSVNDKHGHQVGDEVLRTLGKTMLASARSHDLAARYGGEELVLVLPSTSRATASAIAESLRRTVSTKAIRHGNVNLAVTVSIGVAALEPQCPFKDSPQLLKAADLAVYAAKRAGRNCVRVFAAPKVSEKPAA